MKAGVSMELLFVFLLGFAFTYTIQIFDMLLQWFQMWVSLKVSKIQVEINKLAGNEQQGQEETYCIGFQAPSKQDEYSDGDEYWEDEE